MQKKRKLFCEISPLTYKISVLKQQTIRHLKNIFLFGKLAKTKSNVPLPILIYSHNSLIRRELGNVDLKLQDNKAINLNIAAPKVSNIIVRPGEIFSFWSLVGDCSKKRGYKEGLVISSGKLNSGIGGGMCQFTNLLHWMILHTPLEIIEHHHHDGMDLFPDNGRQIPFGTGTSIMYNYMDYRFKNTTDITFQLITYTTEKYLCGELRADKRMNFSYHIKCKNEFFSKENGVVFRNSVIYKECVDVKTGNLISKNQIMKNHAKVLYDVADDVITYFAE